LGRVLRGGIGCGDENGFAGKGEGEVGEHGLEGVGGEGDEADEQAAGGGGRAGRGCWSGGDIGLRGGHRAMWTFLFRFSGGTELDRGSCFL
jgi:hypothetical protein